MSPRPRKDATESPENEVAPGWAEVLENIGASAAYVRLYRISAGRKVFVNRVGLDVEPEGIQDAYGGGEYELNMCDNRGKVLKGGTYRLQIDGTPKPLPQPGAPDSLARFQATDMAPARDLSEAVRRLDDIYRELRHPPAPIQRADPLELAAGLVTAVSAAVVPIITLMKEGRPRRGGPSSAAGRVEALERGIRIGISLGKGGTGSGWADKLMDMMQPHIDAAAAGAAGPEAPPPLLPALPAEGAAVPDWRQVFARYLPQLMALAAQQRDPTLYADLAVDNAPPELLDMLVQQIARGEDFRRELFQAFPQAVPYREWLTLFLGAVWTAVTQEDGGGPGANGDIPGDIPHPATG